MYDTIVSDTVVSLSRDQANNQRSKNVKNHVFLDFEKNAKNVKNVRTVSEAS